MPHLSDNWPWSHSLQCIPPRDSSSGSFLTLPPQTPCSPDRGWLRSAQTPDGRPHAPNPAPDAHSARSSALGYLDDAQLDRLLEAAGAEARRRGRLDGKTAGGGTRGKPAPVTPGQERLILAAFEAGLKPAAIAREFRLSRAQVDGVVAGAKQRRR